MEHIDCTRMESPARPLTWPNDARQHSNEILTLLQSAGPAIAAAFRLGYIFELGPLAEWVFFDLLDNTTPSVSEPTPPFLIEQWTSATVEFHLGDDSTLSEKDASRCFEQALRALQQRRLPDAKRFCLRYLLTAIASGDDKRQSAALFNLAVAFSCESRWIRAFGLGVLAGAYSSGDKAMMQQIVLPFLARMSNNLSDNDHDSVFTLIPPGAERSVQELIWQIDDLETRRRLETTENTDIN